MSNWLPHATVQFGFALLLTAVTGVVLKVLAKAGTPLVVLACIGVFFIALGLTMRRASAPSAAASPVSGARAPDPPVPPVAPQTEATEYSRQPIFDQAPPELADMSPASLKELFADRTEAQGRMLMEQHVGKPVRVSGQVDGVKQLEHMYSVRLKSVVGLGLFFGADDDAPRLLTLNKGEKIVVSGQINEIQETAVYLDKCKLIEARRRSS
jgi:hypothetical protein